MSNRNLRFKCGCWLEFWCVSLAVLVLFLVFSSVSAFGQTDSGSPDERDKCELRGDLLVNDEGSPTIGQGAPLYIVYQSYELEPSIDRGCLESLNIVPVVFDQSKEEVVWSWEFVTPGAGHDDSSEPATAAWIGAGLPSGIYFILLGQQLDGEDTELLAGVNSAFVTVQEEPITGQLADYYQRRILSLSGQQDLLVDLLREKVAGFPEDPFLAFELTNALIETDKFDDARRELARISGLFGCGISGSAEKSLKECNLDSVGMHWVIFSLEELNKLEH
jgi:hypothetical protein